MPRLIPLAFTALMLTAAPVLAPAWAQETPDAATNAQSNFNRNIPQGLKGNLSEAEINAYQTRLDAAQTPQERNAIHQELQRAHQERQQMREQKIKPKKPENNAKGPKAPDDATKRKLNAPNMPHMGNSGGNGGGNGGGKKK